jgi:hypothetical protein
MNLTEIVAILDKSGSMQHLTNDTIGGYNAFIAEQAKVEGEARLTTVLFSSGERYYEVLHDRVDIKQVEPLTTDDYHTEASTALLDAMGRAIDELGQKLADTPEDERPGKVIFFIVTDGEENSSHKFTHEQIKTKVEHQTDVYKWEFLFIGANIDTMSVASSIGIRAKNAINYEASSVGLDTMYRSVNLVMTSYRNDGIVDTDNI